MPFAPTKIQPVYNKGALKDILPRVLQVSYSLGFVNPAMPTAISHITNNTFPASKPEEQVAY